MTQPRYGIAITADDKTARGRKSAEKNLGLIPKHVSAVNRRAWADDERRFGRHGRSIIRTFGAVEQASARAFGGRSITSGITSRLGAVREAASAAGTGLGEAATAGGVLEGALGGLGVVAGATVGILAAAGYAAFKLTDGWAKGAAQIGRTADIIGVARREMQEFSAAAERMGVDRGAATGGLGSLSQTLNDARYGRNRDALAVLTKLGVALKLSQDGTVDVAAMLPALADAMKRQNSSGRRTMAHALGLSDALIPVLSQGGASLSADMVDAGKVAYVASDDDITRGQRIQRKGATVGQMKDKLLAMAGSAAADLSEPGYDAVIAGGAQALSGATSFGGVVKNVFSPAAEKIERGGRAIERAAAGLTAGVISAAQRVSSRHRGVRASVQLAQYGVESGFGRHMPKGSNNPFGIKARPGQPFVLARTREEDRFGRSYWTMARFRRFDTIEQAFEEHARLLEGKRYARSRNARTADEAADALTGVYATDHRYGAKLKNMMHAHGLERYDTAPPAEIPVKVEIEMRGAPPRTTARVTAGRGSAPAISHAMNY